MKALALHHGFGRLDRHAPETTGDETLKTAHTVRAHHIDVEALWLHLWCGTVDELFAGERAELAKAHALRVGRAFSRRLQSLRSAADPSGDDRRDRDAARAAGLERVTARRQRRGSRAEEARRELELTD